MPQRQLAWSAWNCITVSSPGSSNIDEACLTYDMNTLQHIPRDIYGNVLVTLNPLHAPRPSLTHDVFEYSHPLYNAAAIRSQSLMHKIQNTRSISYAGAWTKYGFHEDGFSSGILVATRYLGAELPFEFTDSTFSRGRRPVLGARDYILRIVLSAVQLWIVIFEAIFGVSYKMRTDLKRISENNVMKRIY